VDILDAHSGALRLRIVLPQQLMTDVDWTARQLSGDPTRDGQRLFAITSSDGSARQHACVDRIQLAGVPLASAQFRPLLLPRTAGQH